MALADYTIARREIKTLKGVVISLRGLNTDDVGVLVRTHLAELIDLFKMVSPDGKLLPDEIDVENILFTLISKFPRAAAMIIALAADDFKHTTEARALPFPVQLKALIAVIELTFEDVGGPLEFAALLRVVISQVRQEMETKPSIQ